MDQFNNTENHRMSDQDFDHFFKSQLENNEVMPDDSNWIKIRKWSPFGPLFTLFKSRGIRVAATLLFLLTATYVFFEYRNQHSSSALIAEIQSTSKLIIQDSSSNEMAEMVSSDFVLDIKPQKEETDIRDQLIEKELDEYLAFLLEDHDEFAGIVDSNLLLKCLEPVEQLPIDEMFAYIPKLTDQEEFTIMAPLETKITLPHRFVAEDENIEEYLLLYEINQLRK